jgi:threonine dehydrogenase-like Zn-dependent dehydrogenase
MRAAVTTGVGAMEMLDVPPPPDPKQGEVIVHPEAVGICGSDFHLYEGELDIFDESPYPRIQGHEVSATIEAVGPGCRPELREGERVALWPLTYCGQCYPCTVGRGNVCDNFNLIGIHTDGGLQERLLIGEAQVFPISSRKPAVAALTEPVSIAVRTVRRARIERGERVVVLGAGPIGQAVQLLAQDYGASVMLVDPLQGRVELGRELGAEAIAWSDRAEVVAAAREWAGGEGVPVAIDATGVSEAIQAGVEMVASAGRVVIVGISGVEVPVNVGSFTAKEFDMIGVSCCQGEEFGEAVAFVEKEGDRLERLISDEFPLERSPQALEYAMEHPTEVMKVVITAS